MYCSNCGHELAPEAKFCSNCGAPVQTGASSTSTSESDRERERREDFERAWGGSRPADNNESREESADSESSLEPSSSEPGTETFAGGFTDRKPTWEVEREKLRDQSDDEWAMFDLGPPKPKRRRTWLWVLLGLIVFFVLACCVFFWWISATESGTEWFEGVATQAAEELQRATDEAATPQP